MPKKGPSLFFFAPRVGLARRHRRRKQRKVNLHHLNPILYRGDCLDTLLCLSSSNVPSTSAFFLTRLQPLSWASRLRADDLSGKDS